MKKLQTICATLTLVLALGATTYAEDGIMGTGAPAPNSAADKSADATPNTTLTQTGAGTDVLDLLVTVGLDVWQNIVTLP